MLAAPPAGGRLAVTKDSLFDCDVEVSLFDCSAAGLSRGSATVSLSRFAEVRKRLGLDMLAAPPAGGRLAVKDSLFVIRLSRGSATVKVTRMGSRATAEKFRKGTSSASDV